jgi:hypothetical protein
MSMDWFRSYHGAPTDPKWLLIAKRAQVRPIHVIGTWWALLDYASQHPERGSIEGFDTETFALFAGLEDEHVSRIVTTLRDKGLIEGERIAQWSKRQPKREDLTAAARKQRERGKSGEKPPPKGGADTPGIPDNDDCHAMSRNVTPDKDKIRGDSSEANASGTVVPHPASDFCKAIFDSGIALLRRDDPDLTERNARSIIGRWRKSITDPELLTILVEAETKSQSLDWVTAAVETRNGNRKPNTPTSQSLRGSRPDPSLDMLRASERAQAACGSAASDWGDHREAGLALPAIWTG